MCLPVKQGRIVQIKAQALCCLYGQSTTYVTNKSLIIIIQA